ncbi:uncharacterized protein C3orf49 homolog [Pelodytes ibericus]
MEEQVSGLLLSGPLNSTNSQQNIPKTSQKSKSNTIREKAKGIVRWHGAVSTNLMNQSVLIPHHESSSESDAGSFIALERKKKSLGQKVKAALGRVMSSRGRELRPTDTPSTAKPSSFRNDSPLFSHKQNRLPKISQHLPLPREMSKWGVRRMSPAATLQLDVNVFEAETEKITADNRVMRSRRTRRMSVMSVPSGLQKVSYSPKKRHFAFAKKKKKKKSTEHIRFHPDCTVGNLQMQVDDLIETMADKSTRLLAQRHEELRKCECLGEEIIQSSKQFQRVTKKKARKYKFRNVCFPCVCCC